MCHSIFKDFDFFFFWGVHIVNHDEIWLCFFLMFQKNLDLRGAFSINEQPVQQHGAEPVTRVLILPLMTAAC